MANPFSALPKILDKRSFQITREVDKITREGARAAGVAAVLATKVDTGKARSNWLASTVNPRFVVIPPYATGNKLGISETANAAGAASQQAQVISTAKPSKGIPIFITNSVKYIGFLQFGTPNISPGNMLGAARQAFVASVKTARIFKK